MVDVSENNQMEIETKITKDQEEHKKDKKGVGEKEEQERC